MGLRIDQCRKLIEPENIFELLPENIFRELLGGFHHWSGRGVVLLWAEFDAGQDKWIVKPTNRLDIHPPTGKEKPEDFSDFCWKLRNEIGIGKCFGSDCNIAQAYVDGIRTESGIYKCWAELGELVYPLSYGGQVRGVLVGGSGHIPPDELGREEIKQTVTALKNGDELWSKLEEHFYTEIKRQTERKQEASLEASLQRLKGLGWGLQGVLDEIYDTRLDRAIHLVQEDLQKIFSKAELSEQKSWWKSIKTLFDDFCKVADLKKILVFQRRYSKYELIGSSGNKKGNKEKLTVKEVIMKVPSGQLKEIEINKIFGLSEFDLEAGSSCWSYRSEQRLERMVLSTLMFIPGQIHKPYHRFVEDFCRIVAGYMDIASMVFMVQEAKSKYERQVGAIAHLTRNPLQNTLWELERFSKFPLVQGNLAVCERLQEVEKRIFDARTDINILLRETAEEIQDIEVTSLLKSVLRKSLFKANKKNCRFREKGEWSRCFVVYGNEARMRMVFTALIDNAVKYSWSNHNVSIGLETFEVGYIEVSISNYGLGIPPEKLEEIKLFGRRGEVLDLKRPVRTGTGWGLPSAIDTIERQGGWLEIESRPAYKGYRAPDERYHRYITEVKVFLPLKDKKQQNFVESR
jgi:signal transduction histidine kinase